MMKIVFPELDNAVIKQAVAEFKQRHLDFEAVAAGDLKAACEMCKAGRVDALVAGIDCPTREMVVACKDYLGPIGKTFSSCFVLRRPVALKTALLANFPDSQLTQVSETLILADAGVTKNPSVEQLVDIVFQTHETAIRVLDEEPRVAMLSFSTFGSAKDESVEKIQQALALVREGYPKMEIDGEMQLDCAVNPIVATKKAPKSKVAGRANVLIVPDLNAGNILYKALEQFGGYVAAGPILQGFTKPCSDLSRGSTVDDVKLVIETLAKLAR